MAASPSWESDLSETVPTNDNHGWQTVTYVKRQRKQTRAPGSDHEVILGHGASDKPNIFRDLEEHAEERRRRAVEAQRSTLEDEILSKNRASPASDEGSDSEVAPKEINDEKPKIKKPKKPKVTVAEAASRIDSSDLSAHLIDISASYEGKQDIQLMRFADYFGRAFSAVSASQFPWPKILKESSVSKMEDIPLCYISEAVYKTSVDWLGQRSPEALGSFILWALDNVLDDLANHLMTVKGSKKPSQRASSKSQVAIFVTLALILRRKPDALFYQLPTLRENPRYHGHERLPTIVWMFAQASHGDLVVGLYACSHNLLPLAAGRVNCNPQSRDLILQLLERILSAPKAQTILLNGAVRKGERLVPPSALELLWRVTFPVPSARLKSTERFVTAYPLLKEVALAGSHGSKSIKQVAQQMLSVSLRAMGENNPDLSKEAADIFIWCLTQNSECYGQWEKNYVDCIRASLVVLHKLAAEWKHQAAKLAPVRQTLKNLRQMNERVLAGGMDNSSHPEFKEADKLCKLLLSRIGRGFSCLKNGLLVVMLALALYAVFSPNLESWDWKKLYVMLTATQTF